MNLFPATQSADFNTTDHKRSKRGKKTLPIVFNFIVKNSVEFREVPLHAANHFTEVESRITYRSSKIL